MSAAEGSIVSAESSSLAARNICNDAYCPAVGEFRAHTSATSFSNPLRKSYRGSIHSNHEPLVKGLAELNEILNTLNVLCKSPVCYNEYMGYSITTAKTNDPNENCKKPMCPFTSKYFHKADKVVQDLTIPPCKGDECPYKDKSLNETGSTCGGSKCIPPTPTPSESYSGCGGPTCPYTKKPTLPSPPTSSSQADTCLGPTCPYNKKSLPVNKPLSDYGGGDDTCGGPTCPYELQKNTPKPETTMGLCGRTSCPFAFVKPSPKSNYRSSYDTQQAITCPYASDMGQNPCGCGACCSYNAQPPPRMPVYSSYQDYGVLKEASRPYSGSLCPYAMSQSARPTRFDLDRDLYSCLYGAELLAAMDPMRKGKSSGSKKEEEVTVSSSVEIDDDKDCECTDPDVKPCGGPECKVTKMTRDCNRDVCPILKVLSFCNNCGGIVVSPRTSNTEQVAANSVVVPAQVSSVNGVIQSIDDLAALSEMAQKSQKNGMKASRKSSVLVDSPVPGEEVWPPKRKKRGKRHRQEALYQYPGVQLGHRDCNYVGKHVPRNMGWLWTAKPQGNLKLWRGYKPGAVPRSVHRMMVKHRRDLGIVDPMDYATRKKRSKSSTKLKEEPKHAITLKKMNGVYTVTVNPIKDPKTVQPSESPFVDCTPMQFKIEKEPAPVVRKQKTWRGCPCDATSTGSEESIEQEASLSESDIEFHFSPPAAIPDLKQKRKKNMQDVETQYNTTDVAGSAPSDKKKAGGANKKGKGKKKGKK